MYIVYVIRNASGILYKGQTNNLQKRLQQHNAADGFQSYTHKHGPWELVYSEKCASRSEAKKREQFLKTGKGREFLSKVIEERSGAQDL